MFYRDRTERKGLTGPPSYTLVVRERVSQLGECWGKVLYTCGFDFACRLGSRRRDDCFVSSQRDVVRLRALHERLNRQRIAERSLIRLTSTKYIVSSASTASISG